MESMTLRVGKSPSDKYGLTNCAVVRSLKGKTRPVYLCVSKPSGEQYYLSLDEDVKVDKDDLGLHLLQVSHYLIWVLVSHQTKKK